MIFLFWAFWIRNNSGHYTCLCYMKGQSLHQIISITGRWYVSSFTDKETETEYLVISLRSFNELVTKAEFKPWPSCLFFSKEKFSAFRRILHWYRQILLVLGIRMSSKMIIYIGKAYGNTSWMNEDRFGVKCGDALGYVSWLNFPLSPWYVTRDDYFLWPFDL